MAIGDSQHICMYVYMYVCMHIYIYIYICTYAIRRIKNIHKTCTLVDNLRYTHYATRSIWDVPIYLYMYHVYMLQPRLYGMCLFIFICIMCICMIYMYIQMYYMYTCIHIRMTYIYICIYIYIHTHTYTTQSCNQVDLEYACSIIFYMYVRSYIHTYTTFMQPGLFRIRLHALR